MWPGLQPEPTTFNSTYVNILEQIVNELGKKEIYSLLDMHQVREYFFMWLISEGSSFPEVLR